ncbi:hypothetical protein TURU_070395 [Turdus rufiventris]|nr:hypothetical protein TURU_070395 [Turdus rufiventris]
MARGCLLQSLPHIPTCLGYLQKWRNFLYGCKEAVPEKDLGRGLERLQRLNGVPRNSLRSEVAETIIRGFAKASIIPGLTSDSIASTETDDSDDEDTGDTGLGLLDAAIAQLMISNMEDKEFAGFMEVE